MFLKLLQTDPGKNIHDMEKEEMLTHLEFALGIFCVISYMVSGHVIDYFARNGYVVLLHESVVAIVIGGVCGAIILQLQQAAVQFNTNVFWYLVLPPIIFAQGYTLKKRNFFKYFPQIALYGVLGTMLTFFIVAVLAHKISRWAWVLEGDCKNLLFVSGRLEESCIHPLTWMEAFLLSAVLSASDEVSALSHIRPEKSPKLGSILFGEGVINDAFSILLFKTIYIQFIKTNGKDDSDVGELFQTIAGDAVWKFFVATAIGVITGLCASRISFRYQTFKDDHIRESSLVLLFGYLSYALGELAGCSGILALFFSGTTLAHYCWHNISATSRTGTRMTFHMMATICEAISFVYVGISAITMKGPYSIRFSILMFLIICAARIVVIFFLTALYKCFSKSFAFTWKEQLGLSAAGMVRGSISWAQALKIAAASHIITTTTLVVVLVSSLTFGVILPPLIKMLGLSEQLDARPTLDKIGASNAVSSLNFQQYLIDSANDEDNTPTLIDDLPVKGKSEYYFYRTSVNWFRWLDDEFMKYYFGGRQRKGRDSRTNSFFIEPLLDSHYGNH